MARDSSRLKSVSADIQAINHPHTLLTVWMSLIALAMVVLMFVNLAYAPRIWYDEGSHLHVPKTLIQDGVYALSLIHI